LASKKKTFYQWLSTRVNFNIRNEENFALKTSLRFSYAQVLVFGSVFFILFAAFSLWIATKVVGIWYNPREDYFNTKKKVIRLALSLDSLQEQVRQKDLFISHLKSIIETGEVQEPSSPESAKEKPTEIVSNKVDLDYMSTVDSLLRTEFESGKSLNSTTKLSSSVGIYEEIMLSPVNGIVTENYDERKSHYGVDIVARKDEPIKAVADGVVIFASWTDDTGYVLGIQHPNNLVSFYKHNSVLHKKVGDEVKAGEIVATIGNTGELTTGPHLHFELWHKGTPINPKELIYF
jgi:murein DD-endopeptidase MepM/ murein hydrolase activator NlpD